MKTLKRLPANARRTIDPCHLPKTVTCTFKALKYKDLSAPATEFTFKTDMDTRHSVSFCVNAATLHYIRIGCIMAAEEADWGERKRAAPLEVEGIHMERHRSLVYGYAVDPSKKGGEKRGCQ